MRVDIPADQKGEMRNILKEMAIRLSHIFPDIEHLAQELKTYSFAEDAPQ